MGNINKGDFFIADNAVDEITEEDYKKIELVVDAAKAFARTCSQSVYIIDYFKKGFMYVSEGIAYLCGEDRARIEKFGYDMYIKHVPEDEQKMLLEINQKGFELFNTFPESERMDYTISYDFHIINGKKRTLINHKLTPILLRDGHIWLAMCVVSHSARKESGQIKVYKNGCNKHLEYNRNSKRWVMVDETDLSDTERKVLLLSARGYKADEIASEICRSLDTVKSCKRGLFSKLGVNNITEALSFASNYKLL